jgi:DNA-directed RNA polymerase subunit omega
MIYPAPDKLDSMGSKYALVIVAAKRARQIKEKARTFVESRSTNPLTVALEEIATGHIVPLQVGLPEALPQTVSAGPVLTGLVATMIDDDLVPQKGAGSRSSILPTPDELEDFSETEGDHDEDDEEPVEVDDTEADPLGLGETDADVDAELDTEDFEAHEDAEEIAVDDGAREDE